MRALGAWQNFYVIVGSSAGALIGLQFVVLSLIAEKLRGRVDPQAGRAFSTPTTIHFTAVLSIAAILSAPWETTDVPRVICGAAGLAGVIFAASITRRMRRQSAYRPEFEDWLFHSILPFAAYATLVVSAVIAWSDDRDGWFGIAAGALLLLLIGIHNAWDAVTYHVFPEKNK